MNSINDEAFINYAKQVCDTSLISLKEFIKGCKEDHYDKFNWYIDFCKELIKIGKDGLRA